MKIKCRVILFSLLCVLVTFGSVMAQSEGITIKLNRDFGYGGMGNEIQGTFSIVVNDKGPFEKVTFMMDDIVLGEVSQAPYKWQFSTDSYAPGQHDYWAVAELADGSLLESNRITGFVLSKEESNASLFKILGTIFGSIAVVGLISWLVSNSVSKKANSGQSFEGDEMPQGFTSMGGTICPKCGRPFAFHFFKLNLLTHKMDRCPHCGKWVLVKSMTYQMVEASIKQSKGTLQKKGKGSEDVNSKDPEEKLKKQIEDSKYTDL